MRSTQQSPVWPYLGVLACLFVLCVTAPRAWEHTVRNESLKVLQAQRARSQITATPKTAPRVASNLKPDQGVDVDPAPLSQPDPSESATAQNDGWVLYPPEPPAPPQPVPPAPEYTQQASEPEPEAPKVAALPELYPSEEETKVTDSALGDAPPKPLDKPAVEETNGEPKTETIAGWPLPRVLLEQLEQLCDEPVCAEWAGEAIVLIGRLCQPPSEPGPQVADIVSRLWLLQERQDEAIAADPPLEAHIARTRYALGRWLGVWESAVGLDQQLTSQNEDFDNAKQLELAAAEVDEFTRHGAPGAAWREYLQLATLRRLAASTDPEDVERLRAAARKTLDRLAPQHLTASQYKFLGELPLVRLQQELKRCAGEPIASRRLLAHLAQYEQSGLASDAHQLANDLRGLQWSRPAVAAKLSEHLETHYRNANARLVLSKVLLNRLMPPQQPVESQVRDTVVNTPVYGCSTTFAKLYVRLIPDPTRVRIGLEARGVVKSDTIASSGPARFRNEGESSFLVRKLLLISSEGLNIYPAVAEADSSYSRLIGMETNFDGLPLVGPLVRNLARSQHDEARGQARHETELKVAARAREQFESEVRPRLKAVSDKVQSQQVAALRKLGLDLIPVGLSTTEERATLRLRLAGTEQLGGHTPRPRAPSDSWLSLQLHQSLFNNTLEKLDLGDRKYALPELFAMLAKRLGLPQLAQQEELPEDVTVQFAKQDPVRIRCEDGHIEATFSFAELTHKRDRWRDFKVHATYTPQPNQLDPRFGRESAIRLEGESLHGLETKLRTIFSKVLSRNRDISVLGSAFTTDPRFKDLEMTQFVVEDGWIGLAYSAQRTSNIARSRKK